MAGFKGGYTYRGVAPALIKMRDQFNALYPHRSKLSDGFLGNAAHAASISFHNPDPVSGLVFGADFTHDPANGLDADAAVAAIIASRDPRVLEIIRNRRYWTPEHGWVPYTGSNPHDKHFHISVRNNATLYNSTAAWSLTGTMKEADDLDAPQAAQLGETLARLQALTVFTGNDPSGRPTFAPVDHAADILSNPLPSAVAGSTFVAPPSEYWRLIDAATFRTEQQLAGLTAAVSLLSDRVATNGGATAEELRAVVDDAMNRIVQVRVSVEQEKK